MKDNVVCGSCRSDQLTPVGFGTERIEQEITDLFPDASVARIDSDTVTDRRKFLSLLKKMHQLEIDILIGTQMIAKGHDFPNVTLVGVVWADGGLSMPDFRAAERTYQLLSQVTGRAGRGTKPGRVIIQTLRPEHYAIKLAQAHDYEQLLEKEMEIRKNPLFPLSAFNKSEDFRYQRERGTASGRVDRRALSLLAGEGDRGTGAGPGSH